MLEIQLSVSHSGLGEFIENELFSLGTDNPPTSTGFAATPKLYPQERPSFDGLIAPHIQSLAPNHFESVDMTFNDYGQVFDGAQHSPLPTSLLPALETSLAIRALALSR